MDQNLIAEKLESLRRCVQRVQRKCPPTAEELMEDPDLQDIISLNLTRAVQLCVDIAVHILADLEVKPPDTMGAASGKFAEVGKAGSSDAVDRQRHVREMWTCLRVVCANVEFWRSKGTSAVAIRGFKRQHC